MLDVAKYHHERYGDEHGYFGVAGENIPYAARIVAVADVHEALTAKREYKPPMPEGDALSMMTAKTEAPALGRAAFDPFLLRRFVAMRLRDPSLDATVVFKGKDLEVVPGRHVGDAGLRITADSQAWLRVLNRDLELAEAIGSKLVIPSDENLMAAYMRCFPR